MTQPDNFGFGEEAALLKASARKFFTEKLPTSTLHALVAGDHRPERGSECLWDSGLWQEMVGLGWTMLAVPESAGGVGMPAVAVAGLAEELGRAAFPCPLLGTINASYVLAACGTGGEQALAEIAQGCAATLAVTNEQGSWSPGDTDVTAAAGKLTGTAWFVQDARKVDRLLVSARTDAGIALYWVESDASGVTVHTDTITDLTRDQAHISFDNVTAAQVCANGLAALGEALPAIWTVLAADMVGAAEWQLQATVEYVGTRSSLITRWAFSRR